MSETATAALTGDNGGTASGAAPSTAAPESNVWGASFDEETQAYVGAKGWQSPNDLLQSYRNLEKFAGGSKNLLELPGVDAEDSAWDQVYSRLGRPESPDGYEFPQMEGADPELTEWFKGTAHQLGLTGKQAAKLYDAWNGIAGEKMQAIQQAEQQQSAQALESLQKEWGRAFDSQISAGKQAVNALGYSAEQLDAIEAKLGTAETLKLFATIGSKMGEPSFEGSERSGESGFGITPAAARQQIADLKMDKNFMENYIAGNPDAIAKMKRLMESAYE
jgi:hypothetical protein